MSIFGSSSAAKQAQIIPLPPVSGPSASIPMPPQTIPGSGKGSGLRLPTYPGEDKACEPEDPQFMEYFSRGLLKTRMIEFRAGKFTKRYVEAYLEFMHLSGMVSNLEYLEYKSTLSEEL